MANTSLPYHGCPITLSIYPTNYRWVTSIHRAAKKRSSRKLARAIGNDKAPGLFTEGFYRYPVLSTSPNATNHHLNLLAQRFIFRLRDRLEPLRVSLYERFPMI